MSHSYQQIGPFSRRVGVSADLLRAWERRYGVPRPSRTANGVRLYSSADERLVEAMRRALAQGIPAAEAARLAADQQPPSAGDPSAVLAAVARRLAAALHQFDDAGAQDQLDHLFGVYGTDTALSRVILPYLHQLGEQWACGEVGVGHEHFASNLIHARLLSLARKWDQGRGPLALLACPSGELHTIGLLSFGLALRMRGWRITYLGADTPIAAIATSVQALKPTKVVLASLRSEVYLGVADELAELAESAPVALGGAGVGSKLAADLGAALLADDPITEAARVASSVD
jgi:MerR family transcriptional regulator, light-induced transcriptional regulator